MLHALGEAVYQLSAERNPNLITLSAYAPSLQASGGTLHITRPV